MPGRSASGLYVNHISNWTRPRSCQVRRLRVCAKPPLRIFSSARAAIARVASFML